MQKEPRPPREWLPIGATLFLVVATVVVIARDLVPALADHRQAEAALRSQIERYDELFEDRKEKARKLRSLQQDPQAVERALDEKAPLPTPRPEER